MNHMLQVQGNHHHPKTQHIFHPAPASKQQSSRKAGGLLRQVPGRPRLPSQFFLKQTMSSPLNHLELRISNIHLGLTSTGTKSATAGGCPRNNLQSVIIVITQSKLQTKLGSEPTSLDRSSCKRIDASTAELKQKILL